MEKKLAAFKELFFAVSTLQNAKKSFQGLVEDGDVRLRDDEVSQIKDLLATMGRDAAELEETVEWFSKLVKLK